MSTSRLRRIDISLDKLVTISLVGHVAEQPRQRHADAVSDRHAAHRDNFYVGSSTLSQAPCRSIIAILVVAFGICEANAGNFYWTRHLCFGTFRRHGYALSDPKTWLS